MSKQRDEANRLLDIYAQAVITDEQVGIAESAEAAQEAREAVLDAMLSHNETAFFKWADKSKATTWAGKLGLKERWLNRDNPEYQKKLETQYGEKKK